MAVTSSLDIVQLSLDLLANREASLNLESPTNLIEEVSARWYDITRESLLRQYIWNFAKARQSISKSTTTPAFDYSAEFVLPQDFIRLISVGGTDEKNFITDYDLQGDRLLVNTDANSLKLRYVRNEEDVNKFDPLFKMLLSHEIAVHLTYHLKLKTSVRREILIATEEYRAKAAAVDGQERKPIRINRSKYIQARRYPTSGRYASPYYQGLDG